jgi:glycosyltransferase involved in cell wall biosynthesis
MTRIGMNPARDRVGDYRPARVTVAVLACVPYLEGYFKRRWDLLRLCLGSILANTHEPYDLLVFDNGSCEAVRAYLDSLLEAGRIQYLLSASKNIGKIGAFKLMFPAAPGEIIAYCDDDMFFYPGWLSAHLELLDRFPRVGAVSGSPIRDMFGHGIQSNLRFAEGDPETRLLRGHTIPVEWEIDWADSYGRDHELHRQWVDRNQDIILERRGVKAYAAANHNQFVSPKSVATALLPKDWSGRLMGGMVEFDNAMDAQGYLRLSTLGRTTKHMGNMATPELVSEARALGVDVEGVRGIRMSVPKRDLLSRIVDWKPVHWFVYGLYNRLFWLLSQQSGEWLKVNKPDRKRGRG